MKLRKHKTISNREVRNFLCSAACAFVHNQTLYTTLTVILTCAAISGFAPASSAFASPPETDPRAVLQAQDFAPIFSGVQAPRISRLADAMQHALLNNSELQFESARLEQARATLGVAFSEWFPKLTVYHNKGSKHILSNSSSDDRTNFLYGYHDYVIELRQNLFSGFATKARWSRAEDQFRADELRLTQAKQKIGFDVVNVFIEVQRARRNYQIIRQAHKQVNELLVKVRQRGSAGVVAPVEILRLESRLLSLENQLYDQLSLSAAATNRFYEVTRGQPDTHLDRVNAYPGYTLENLSKINLPELTALLDVHPLKLQAQLYESIRLNERAEAHSGYLPKLDFVARRTTGNNTTGYINVPGNDQYDTTLLLNFEWTLFDGFGAQKRASQADYARASASYATKDVVIKQEERIANSWKDMTISSWRLLSARAGATAAKEAAAKYEELVFTGRRTLVEGVNIIEERMRAELELSSQEHFAVLNSYKLAFEVGILDPSFIAGERK